MFCTVVQWSLFFFSVSYVYMTLILLTTAKNSVCEFLVVLYMTNLMKIWGLVRLISVCFFFLSFFWQQKSIHIYLFIRVIYTFIFLHISHSSFHTAEKCICLLYYYRVLVQCTFFVLFVHEEQSCYSLSLSSLSIYRAIFFLIIISYLFYCEKDIRNTLCMILDTSIKI